MPTPQPTLADQVMARLREEIIAGKLAPGTMVAEIPTSVRFGVSRVPVREATRTLERDGLLVFEPSGRSRVRELTARDFAEIYGIRMLLEVEAFRLAARFHEAEDSERLAANIAKMERARSLAQVALLDIEYHEWVLAAARQSRLLDLWKTMRGQIQLFTATAQRELQLGRVNVQQTAVESHREGLKIIQSRCETTAMEFARAHLKGWGEWLDKTHLGVES